ncbi:Fe-S cluster assembly protein Cia2/MIP18(mitotic spindle-associated MMXD complex subunit) [Monocercomonoides exilis]|uniref:Fe-S cluster assembly protein Cia2/MIP18(mitotic spindle-associated MMXD complex subunit) n=1 Tax=Monocercomonoides exilis TaxID=2049356 RepID=UPI0035594148|nr:Fe-S cluster assembly protein Cia2/MIP18(mitotic spindle-associated MMXD complex subunit) [Monocercomonoides exilis]|eukprot:MONOS_12715.1-p1 / transcript=MONOS_12715.1 / gene=MONOS_12715 / organism=Monocercomonoides_exilis_PA203 / gene_product=Fe-S cluster assembly protein Cia2/MIP18(mitotic spindle-associated MMXD complex subunit) / transcript_product=Fe-S cluster assembly protein Cia2/MIP18(mitotic spindle-associated MMXD complex subunit) / location=Mono_scaffold00724:11006-11572(-) / protein_length=150 / sequence_SO=supercontig / SO=protein_coding / is_pseudo=false
MENDNEENLSQEDIYNLLKYINDPEYPQTLEELNIISPESIECNYEKKTVTVTFTPTVPHCSMCMILGLSIISRLRQALPLKTKIFVKIYPGSHKDEESVNKQLADKERVAAAMENPRLGAVVRKCLVGADKDNILEWAKLDHDILAGE